MGALLVDPVINEPVVETLSKATTTKRPRSAAEPDDDEDAAENVDGEDPYKKKAAAQEKEDAARAVQEEKDEKQAKEEEGVKADISSKAVKKEGSDAPVESIGSNTTSAADVGTVHKERNASVTAESEGEELLRLAQGGGAPTTSKNSQGEKEGTSEAEVGTVKTEGSSSAVKLSESGIVKAEGSSSEVKIDSSIGSVKMEDGSDVKQSETGSVKTEGTQGDTNSTSGAIVETATPAPVEEEGTRSVGAIKMEGKSGGQDSGTVGAVKSDTEKGKTDKVAEPDAGFDGAESVPTMPPDGAVPSSSSEPVDEGKATSASKADTRGKKDVEDVEEGYDGAETVPTLPPSEGSVDGKSAETPFAYDTNPPSTKDDKEVEEEDEELGVVRTTPKPKVYRAPEAQHTDEVWGRVKGEGTSVGSVKSEKEVKDEDEVDDHLPWLHDHLPPTSRPRKRTTPIPATPRPTTPAPTEDPEAHEIGAFHKENLAVETTTKPVVQYGKFALDKNVEKTMSRSARRMLSTTEAPITSPPPAATSPPPTTEAPSASNEMEGAGVVDSFKKKSSGTKSSSTGIVKAEIPETTPSPFDNNLRFRKAPAPTTKAPRGGVGSAREFGGSATSRGKSGVR